MQFLLELLDFGVLVFFGGQIEASTLIFSRLSIDDLIVAHVRVSNAATVLCLVLGKQTFEV